MSKSFSLALAVKELERGEFHWILMDKAPLSDDLMSYAPKTFSDPFRNAEAAWVAGYLRLRTALRKAASG